MELHAYTRTISDLFSVKRKYVVPRFQREYSWTKEQVRELWDDITMHMSLKGAAYEHEEYFIGALVLVGDDKSPILQIVDGQQRLTTITILLSALCDRFVEIGKANIAESIYENYIAGKDDDGNEYFKLENETPKPFFQTNIQHLTKETQDPTSDEEKTLQASYKDLYQFSSKENLAQSRGVAAKSISNEEYEIYLKALRDQVVKNLKVIFITVNEEEEAYTIFETLNARGMNLSFVDLIKNKLFKELTSKHPDDKAKTSWKSIRTVISSRDSVGSMETFVRHWWISKYSYVSAEKVYANFKKLWGKGEINAQQFINDLHEDAKLYIQIAAPNPDDFKQQEDKYIYKSLNAFKIFGLVQQRPFLLSLLRAKRNKTLKTAEIKETLTFLENFHYKFNAVCSLRPSGVEGSYSKAARDLRAAKNRTEAKTVLKTLTQRLKEREPELTTFKEKFSEIAFYKGYTKDKKLIQYTFTKMEVHLNGSNELVPENITLEHILSQSKGKETTIGQIGNLLPLSAELNIAAGNKDIPQKVGIYQSSQFEMAKAFSSGFTGKWELDEISKRTDELAESAYTDIWKLKD